MTSPPKIDYAPYIARYRQGVWRDRILHDLILEDAHRLGERPTFLDIGCGRGFDGDIPLQHSLARAAGQYIGIEPDPEVTPEACCTTVLRCRLEDAPLPPGSVQVAFAVMVLEHLAEPQAFWDKLYELLADGGVFWGLTVDGRHWFCQASLWSEHLRLKDVYLRVLLGARGSARYENYPVYYRSNTPEQIARQARRFHSCEFVNLARVGQCADYLPRFLRPLAKALDQSDMRRGKPGTLLAVRAVK